MFQLYNHNVNNRLKLLLTISTKQVSGLCCKYTIDTKRHQMTPGDFSQETSDRFHPLNFFFLSAKSFVFLVHLCHLELLVG